MWAFSAKRKFWTSSRALSAASWSTLKSAAEAGPSLSTASRYSLTSARKRDSRTSRSGHGSAFGCMDHSGDTEKSCFVTEVAGPLPILLTREPSSGVLVSSLAQKTSPRSSDVKGIISGAQVLAVNKYESDPDDMELRLHACVHKPFSRAQPKGGIHS